MQRAAAAADLARAVAMEGFSPRLQELLFAQAAREAASLPSAAESVAELKAMVDDGNAGRGMLASQNMHTLVGVALALYLRGEHAWPESAKRRLLAWMLGTQPDVISVLDTLRHTAVGLA